MPTPEDFDIKPEGFERKIYGGGETLALKHLEKRLLVESRAFQEGSFMPNQRNPDILCPPMSLSPALRFGALSVRKFYWGLMDAFNATRKVRS